MFLENISSSNQVTMNSQEIAGLVQSRHDVVKKSIERLASRGVIELPPVVEIKTATKPSAIYIFSGDKGKRDSVVVVAQLSPEFTAKIVDRWIELEQQAAKARLPDFTNPVTAARAWADEFEAKQAALIQLEQAKPKINHYDTVVERSALLNATEVGSKIGLTAQELNKFLEAKGVYDTRIKRSRSFRHWFIEAGYGQTKQTANGYPQSLFTTKGEAWIIETFSKGVA